MADTPPFADATALIFGGAKGIGRGVALDWARRGARVAVADIDHAAAGDTAAAIEAAGDRAIGLAADVLSEASIARAAVEAEAALGPVDIVMNNVGGILSGHPEDIPLAEWQRMMDLNFFAAIRSLGVFLPKFQARGSGTIVNTASFAGLFPYAANRMPYAAAKAAVISLSENLAVYLEPQGIRVSCLVPGPVMTSIMDQMRTWTPDCPMRGPGGDLELKTVEEVAVTLADGMEAGRVLIPSDADAWTILRDWAASPDAFIRAKIEAFAAGDSGKPRVPEALLRRLSEGTPR